MSLAIREWTAHSSIGTKIHVRESGEGDPIILCDGLGCEGFIWKYLMPALSRDHRVIHWHYRGHGRSEVPNDASDFSIEGFAEDLRLLLDETAGDRRAVLIGHSLGVQVLLEAAIRENDADGDRLRALIPLCGSPGRPLDTFMNSRVGLRVLPHILALLDRRPDILRKAWKEILPRRFTLAAARLTQVNERLLARGDLAPYMQSLSELEPGVFLHTLENASRHDTLERLHRVRVPTLVVAAQQDSFTPLARSTTMRRRLVDSELFVLPNATHTGPLEWPEYLELRIRKFLRERAWQAPRGTEAMYSS